jgi:hypothetical protein
MNNMIALEYIVRSLFAGRGPRRRLGFRRYRSINRRGRLFRPGCDQHHRRPTIRFSPPTRKVPGIRSHASHQNVAHPKKIVGIITGAYLGPIAQAVEAVAGHRADAPNVRDQSIYEPAQLTDDVDILLIASDRPERQDALRSTNSS